MQVLESMSVAQSLGRASLVARNGRVPPLDASKYLGWYLVRHVGSH